MCRLYRETSTNVFPGLGRVPLVECPLRQIAVSIGNLQTASFCILTARVQLQCFQIVVVCIVIGWCRQPVFP